ncbi:MAG: inositol monophosphatase family protein [Hyphomicrobiaceae bacterium]
MAASALLTVMINAARKAGRSLSRDFGEVENLQVSVKGPGDFVSAADDRAEEIIFRELRKARPTYGFLMEESGVFEGEDKDQRWIVDPLDGTTNFLHSNPLFSISIALERHGQLVAGVVYNPITDELFTAEKGKGAFVNDRRLRVAGRRNVSEALITTGIPHRGRGEHDGFIKDMKTVMSEVIGIRRTGSAALDLAWTAAGRFDVFWERALKPWDVAAGIVLMREAGGQVIDIDGGDDPLESGNILAANPQMLKAFAPLVARKK